MTEKKPSLRWPGAKLRKLSEIVDYPNNPRTHPEAEIEMLAGMMARHGVDQPIVVDEHDVILKGHGRKRASLKIGWTEFPVVQRKGLSAAEKMAIRIQDNQVSLLAGWDQSILIAEIGDLKLAGYDVKLLGFGDATLRSFDPTPSGDEIPPTPKTPTSRIGDLWHLDRHRLICGDATDAETWKRFGSERAAMVFVDPPYGVTYTSASKPGRKFSKSILSDEKRHDALYKMLLASFRQMKARCSERAAFYIWHANLTREDFAQAMKAAGIRECQYLMWIKPGIITGHSDYQQQTEPCFYASSSDDSAPKFYGDRMQSTVWRAQIANAKEVAITIGSGVVLLDGEGGTLFVQSRAPKAKKLRHVRIPKDGTAFLSGSEGHTGTAWEVGRDGGYEHPTQKPVELARRAIENSSLPGEIVIDGFLGSGTTLIGAESTGRRCFGLELDPVFCDVIIRRWEKVSQKQATLGPGGPTFAETAAARAKGRPARKNAPARPAGRNRPKEEPDAPSPDRESVRRKPRKLGSGNPAAVAEPPVRPAVRQG